MKYVAEYDKGKTHIVGALDDDERPEVEGYTELKAELSEAKELLTKANEQLEQANKLLGECEDEFHRMRLNEDSYDDEQTVLGEIFLTCESMETKLKARKQSDKEEKA